MQDQVMTRLTHASDQLEKKIKKMSDRINENEESLLDSPSKISYR